MAKLEIYRAVPSLKTKKARKEAKQKQISKEREMKQEKQRRDKWSKAKDIKGTQCALCGKKLTLCRAKHMLENNLEVVAINELGHEVVIRACTAKCRNAAWKRYERKKEWLEAECRDMRNVERMRMSVLQALREVEKSQQEVCKQQVTSPN